ncbi:MAG: squalene synthase HpnC [Phycisphaerales bacterium]|nr:squalene synthase HpnC [Phycisphaerales bacterium]
MSPALAQPATKLLEQWGPSMCAAMAPMSHIEAATWCAQLTNARSENFPVLSSLLSEKSQSDFAAIYAFCRWADDLGDEAQSPENALELLAWWRHELRQCYHGSAKHPIFIALKPVIARHGLPENLFDELIQAFEWDNRQTRWESMEELSQYCALSANPVGRLVLAVLGEPRDETLAQLSDCTCTALQLVNHWQDVKRDLLQRERVYLPRDAWSHIPDFESRLLITARRGWAADLDFLPAYREMLSTLCDHTEQLFDRGQALLRSLSPTSRPVVGLFTAGGRGVLKHIRQWNFETCIRRPNISRVEKLFLVSKAWLAAHLQRGAA